ncbi:hypothetical protein K458DRAFT_446862 [Lentithecium fluviatile CBS 122367]|uniref:Protein kinase domain-containing protein n=1 Tax=Lentithecium fluviatile CBS 122367 TaxID=1168545 RepID=A0A6G1IHZ6_9PLEO|nr:hypothetical protein K458DRAFT_446862 [Lentithecium fluviatile CBS 122367]
MHVESLPSKRLADHANEQKVFQILGNGPRIPYLIMCIHTVPNHTFLEYVPNGSLAELLGKYQKRNEAQVIAITQTIDHEDICRMVHGDIRPGNMLFSSTWNLRLSDLDRSIPVGDDLEAVSEPFGRLLSQADGEGAGTYGKAGVSTEAFAIGSIYYTLLRGHEPYEMEDWGRDSGVILVDKFQNREFQYNSLRELLAEFMDGVEEDEKVQDLEQGKMLQECISIAKSGFLDTLER